MPHTEDTHDRPQGEKAMGASSSASRKRYGTEASDDSSEEAPAPPNGYQTVADLAATAASNLETILKTSRLPKRQISQIHTIFTEICPNLKMRRTKLPLFCKKFLSSNHAKCQAFLDHLFRAYDTNGDGLLDYFEFLEVVDTLYCGPTKEKLDLTFRVCDVDGNGTVEREELQTIIGLILQMRKMSTSEDETPLDVLAKSMFERLDTDNDGHLTRDEFVNGCSKEPLIYHTLSEIFTLR